MGEFGGVGGVFQLERVGTSSHAMGYQGISQERKEFYVLHEFYIEPLSGGPGGKALEKCTILA